MEEILKVCLQFGSHLDVVNSTGRTIYDLAESDEMKALIRQYQFNNTTLKCLASRVIVQQRMDYQELVPFLRSFIQLHDRRKGSGGGC